MTVPAKPLPLQDLELILAQTAPLWEEMRGRRIFSGAPRDFFQFNAEDNLRT